MAIEERTVVVEKSDNVAARIVRFVTGAILTLLAVRFVLALLGANPENVFAELIYGLTNPFVAPFFTLFNYDLDAGIARFELFTLVAMLVYGIVGYGIAALLNSFRNNHRQAYSR